MNSDIDGDGFQNSAEPYAFVEFADYYTASQALTAMNRRMLLDKEMKVNWATQPGTQVKIDTSSKLFEWFRGDRGKFRIFKKF